MARRIKNLVIHRIDLVDKGASQDEESGEGAHVVLFKRDAKGRDVKGDAEKGIAVDCPSCEAPLPMRYQDGSQELPNYCPECGAKIDLTATGGAAAQKAVWTAAYINNLPDSSFAVIESGGEKDADGKTTPRSLRHLPYKDAGGKVDLPHLRNALARLPQTQLSAELKAKAKAKLDAAARTAGVGEAGKEKRSTKMEKLPKEKLEGLDEETRDYIAALEASATGEGKEETEVQKALNDRVAKAESEAKAANDRVAKIENERQLEIMKRRVEAEFGTLPGASHDELAATLKDLRDKAPQEYAKLEPLLKTWSNAIATGPLFGQRGVSGAAGASASATEQVEAMVSERLQKKLAKDYGEAVSQIMRENPALYQRYRREATVVERGGNE